MAEAAGRKSLLQISLVYINTLMIQRVLGEPNWTQRMTPEDLRALTPLTYTHVTPYGMFRFDMNKRLDIDASGLLPDVRPGRTLPLVTRMFLQGLPGSAGALLSVLLAGPAVIVAQSPLTEDLVPPTAAVQNLPTPQFTSASQPHPPHWPGAAVPSARGDWMAGRRAAKQKKQPLRRGHRMANATELRLGASVGLAFREIEKDGVRGPPPRPARACRSSLGGASAPANGWLGGGPSCAGLISRTGFLKLNISCPPTRGSTAGICRRGCPNVGSSTQPGLLHDAGETARIRHPLDVLVFAGTSASLYNFGAATKSLWPRVSTVFFSFPEMARMTSCFGIETGGAECHPASIPRPSSSPNRRNFEKLSLARCREGRNWSS